MILKVSIPNLKPVSTNAMYEGRMKSLAYVKQERAVDGEMLAMRLNVKKFMDSFDEHKHIINAHMVVEIPKENLFVLSGKRKGCINKRCIDIDNCVKTVQDSIFYNIPLIEDAMVRSVTVEDILSKDQFYHTHFYIWKVEKDMFYKRTLKSIQAQILQSL